MIRTIAGSSAATRRALNAWENSRRTRVWSGPSVKKIDLTRVVSAECAFQRCAPRRSG
jgi:hypothetical protein